MAVEGRKYAAASHHAYHQHDAQYVSLLYMYCFMNIPSRPNAGLYFKWIIQMFLSFEGKLSLLRLHHVMLAIQH